MRILVTGSSGFVGSALCQRLKKEGHSLVFLKRGNPSKKGTKDQIFWDPEKQLFQQELFENFDGVIHLAGESLFSWRWTKRKKETIWQSRVGYSQLLCHILKDCKKAPDWIIAASAVGIYGDRKEEILTEKSALGKGFLATLCREWEEAFSSLPTQIRVIHARFGIVMDLEGGFLKKLLPFYRHGLGAILGSGEEFISWIALQDLISILLFLIEDQKAQGVFLCTAPHPIQQKEFAKEFAKEVGSFLFFKIPSFFIRLFLGLMGEELILSSQRAIPEKLLQKGFSFQKTSLFPLK